MAITRQSLVQEILTGLNKVDIDPSFSYGTVVMERPQVCYIKGDYAYAYGPDGNVWMADVINESYIDWSDAGPLYTHLEFMYGELFKLKLMDDDNLYIIMASMLHVVRELNRLILES